MASVPSRTLVLSISAQHVRPIRLEAFACSAHVLRPAGTTDHKINCNYVFSWFVSINKREWKMMDVSSMEGNNLHKSRESTGPLLIKQPVILALYERSCTLGHC